MGKDDHGHAEADMLTRTDGHEKTDSYGKDGQAWQRHTVMEKTHSYGIDTQLWKRQTVMEKTGSYERRTVTVSVVSESGTTNNNVYNNIHLYFVIYIK